MTGRSLRSAGAALLLPALAGAAAAGAQEARPPFEGTAFAVFVLSRGKGVPEPAREVLRKVEEVVRGDRERGVKVESRRTRIGLEGETKLCVEYASASDARRAHEQVETIVKGVDLVNLVPGPCSGKAKPDEKEGKP